jgi:ribosome-binding protein aMBF1 (putative translation factor)
MKTKICKKCGRELLISEFYVHKQMEDGHLNFCKDCVKIRVNKHRKENIEKIREYDRNRPNNKERGKKERKAIYADEKRLAKYREQKQEWAKKNKHKKNAHTKLKRAIKKGIITRPKYCQLCGKTNCEIQGHHYDYNKPLEVIWVCTECHGNLHKTYNKMRIPF